MASVDGKQVMQLCDAFLLIKASLNRNFLQWPDTGILEKISFPGSRCLVWHSEHVITRTKSVLVRVSRPTLMHRIALPLYWAACHTTWLRDFNNPCKVCIQTSGRTQADTTNGINEHKNYSGTRDLWLQCSTTYIVLGQPAGGTWYF